MNTEKTPLVQKLTLAVLSLILVCLVVLIAQNRARQSVNITEVPPAAEEPPPTALEPAEIPAATTPERPPVRVPARTPVAPTAPEAAVVAVEPQPAPAQRPVPVTPLPLVNPFRPEPLEVVVQSVPPLVRTEICGQVRLVGNPPREIPIALDAHCRALHEEPLTTRHYVVGRARGLANVLVYIKEGLPKYYPPPEEVAPILTASRCIYDPYVLGVQAGKKFTIFNADPILHNFHATSKTNRDFNLALATSGQKVQKSFEHPEIFVRVKCDVHPWEFAYIAVVDHPFFAVTDANGVFCLPAGLPQGRYPLAAVHVKAGESLQEIVVSEAPVEPIQLVLNVPRAR